LFLNIGRDVLIIKDCICFKFIRYYKGYYLELYEIYCRIERTFVYKIIVDWNVVWSVLEEDK